MSISIEGKKILVTGGARGIGGGAARYFAKHGANVVTFDIKDERGEQLAREATKAGPGKVTYRHVNLANVDEIRSGVEYAAAELGGLDAVFNVAAVATPAPADAIPESDWDNSLTINVKGLAYVCEAAFPHLKKNGGSIINFSSGAALMDGPVNMAVYSAAKGAVISYSRSIAREWAKYNIRVNSLIPNAMTEIVEETLAALTPEGRKKFEEETFAQIPLGGKLGEIETDLAPMLLFLASDGAKYITSQIINVDGGLTYTR